MSLAVLARKTRAKQRLQSLSSSNRNSSTNVGFVLNMTGRGKNKLYCGTDSKADCGSGGCYYGGMSQPAPQMSYGTYNNRKSNAAYMPGGKMCCDGNGTNKIVWKQKPDINASTITEYRRHATIRCTNALVKRKARYIGDVRISNRITSRPACGVYNSDTCSYDNNGACSTHKTRVGYTRINHNHGAVTKKVGLPSSSSDYIAIRKQRAFRCDCNTNDVTCNSGPNAVNDCSHCDNNSEYQNKLRANNRFCFTKPMSTDKCGGI